MIQIQHMSIVIRGSQYNRMQVGMDSGIILELQMKSISKSLQESYPDLKTVNPEFFLKEWEERGPNSGMIRLISVIKM